jgi:hypothetical protein
MIYQAIHLRLRKSKVLLLNILQNTEKDCFLKYFEGIRALIPSRKLKGNALENSHIAIS